MLHVTNGRVAADRIRQSGTGGDIVMWQDVLHDGPVPAGLDDDELREMRARFIAAEGWASLEEVRAELAARDEALAATDGPVVLWFEHDLYDQLQLLQVLDRVAGRLREGWGVEAVSPPTYLGHLGADAFRKLFEQRREVPPEAFALASAGWAAFRSPDPRAVERLLAGDTGALPHLRAALRRHLEEFPDLAAGLSRTERQALEALAGGAGTVREAFRAAHHAREEAVFLGDVAFLSVVRRLAGAPRPLVRSGHRGGPLHLDARIHLTESGAAVLAGKEDLVRDRGVDRWLGGVHIAGRAVGWRWDPRAGRLAGDGAGA